MDFDQLRLFVDLVGQQNFTKVAERNCITQPAVTLSIRKLEEELGTRLLERTTRKVLVTEEGRILYRYAQEILGKAQEAKAVLLERQQKMLGNVRLATVHSAGLYELPEFLREFIRRYPQVGLHIEYKVSEQVYQMVRDGEADLGLVAFPEARPGIEALPFYEDELVIICSADHPLQSQEQVRVSALAGQAFVTFQTDMPTRREIDAALARHNVRVDVRLQCDNIDILKKMVEVGLGISMVPLLTVRQEARDGRLRVLHLADHTVRRPLALIHRAGRGLSRPQRAFVELVTGEGAEILAACARTGGAEKAAHCFTPQTLG